MNLHAYRDKIAKLQPLSESSFEYKTTRWHKLDLESAKFIIDYEDKIVSREDVILAFENYYSGILTWQTPFLLTMVWGFADNGYGTFRTNKYILDENNRDLIIDAFEAVKTNKIKLAFKSLKKIHGLGVSYISKILYFATRACAYEEYAPIFDIRVARSLIKLSAIPELFDIVEIQPSSKFIHYIG